MVSIFYLIIASVLLYYTNETQNKVLIDRIPGLMTAYGLLWSLLIAIVVIMTQRLVEFLKE
jgi:hypothetical protein